MVDDIGKRRFVNAGPFINAITGVESDVLLGNAAQRMIETLDIQIRSLDFLLVVEGGIAKNVR